MPSTSLSPAKLEKKLLKLERNLRAELTAEFECLIEEDRLRLSHLEAQLEKAFVNQEQLRVQIQNVWLQPEAGLTQDLGVQPEALSAELVAGCIEEVRQSMAGSEFAPAYLEYHPWDAAEALHENLASTMPRSKDETVVNAGARGDTKRPLGSRLQSVYGGGVDAEAEGIHYEPIPFVESAWNLVLVTGHSEISLFDNVIACLVFFLSVCMQVAFTYIVMSPQFTGLGIGAERANANAWRFSFAHDYLYMNSAKVSLVTRVCAGDSSLIYSTGQSDLIKSINTYLGLSSDLKDPKFLPKGSPDPLAMGPMLCFLCILLWTLYLCHEIRSNLVTSWAVSRIPISHRSSIEDGKIMSLSWVRAAVFYLLQVARLTICGFLLYAGVVWLVNTTSIENLILNAVALGAILDIDGIAFSAIMPESLQKRIQDLEAIRVKYTKRRSQSESALAVSLVAVTGALSIVFLLLPLLSDMRDVKALFCAGQQNFIVGENFDTGTLHMFETNEVAPSDWTVLQAAVERAIETASFNESLLIKAQSYVIFDKERTSPIDSWASSIENQAALTCADFSPDNVYGLPEETFEIESAMFRTVTAQLGKTHAKRCEDLVGDCDERESRLLRFLCPVTCGCANPLGNRFYRTPTHGCRAGCEKASQAEASQRACVDKPPRSLGDSWVRFWYHFANETVRNFGDSSQVKSAIQALLSDAFLNGCETLQRIPTDNFTGSSFCAGATDFGPLVYLCPDACGCGGQAFGLTISPGSELCPTSCAACFDEGLSANLKRSFGLEGCEAALQAGVCEKGVIQKHCPRSCKLCICPDAEAEDFPARAPAPNCSAFHAQGLCTVTDGRGTLEQRMLANIATRYCRPTCDTCRPPKDDEDEEFGEK